MHREDAPLADEPQPASVPNDMPQGPSGLPDEDAPESDPMGVPEADPDGEDAPRRGAGHQPGIPTEGEPPSGG